MAQIDLIKNYSYSVESYTKKKKLSKNDNTQQCEYERDSPTSDTEIITEEKRYQKHCTKLVFTSYFSSI